MELFVGFDWDHSLQYTDLVMNVGKDFGENQAFDNHTSVEPI